MATVEAPAPVPDDVDDQFRRTLVGLCVRNRRYRTSLQSGPHRAAGEGDRTVSANLLDALCRWGPDRDRASLAER